MTVRVQPLIWIALAVVCACTDDPVTPPAKSTGVAAGAVSHSAAVTVSDRSPLVALYGATDGPNWRNRGNWLTDAPVEDWYGVTVDDHGRVTSLHLGNNRLAGRIPPQLGGLDRLEHLNLEGNDLTGPIPKEIGSLSHLVWLALGHNELAVYRSRFPGQGDGLNIRPPFC